MLLQYSVLFIPANHKYNIVQFYIAIAKISLDIIILF